MLKTGPIGMSLVNPLTAPFATDFATLNAFLTSPPRNCSLNESGSRAYSPSTDSISSCVSESTRRFSYRASSSLRPWSTLSARLCTYEEASVSATASLCWSSGQRVAAVR